MKKTLKPFKRLLFGFIDAINNLILQNKTRRKIKKILINNSEIKLELGAEGKIVKKGWLTLDMNKKCDLFWDLRNGIPFPDESINMIYSSHLFEHLTFNEIEVLLKECKRVLKYNGVFSICVPNAKLYFDAYIKKDSNFFIPKSMFCHWAINDTTNIDILNYIAYMDGEHKYMFDQENLLFILNKNGFRDIQLRNFNIEIDITSRDYQSIYAEGLK